MAEPIEYRRIFQKVATYDEWMANPLILGDGEWANVRVGGVIVNYRIGDGTKRFSELPNVIQYDQAAYVAPNGNTLPVPQNGIGYSILTAGSYNDEALVVPANNLGVADYVGNMWVVRNMVLPTVQLNVPGGAARYEDVKDVEIVLGALLDPDGEQIVVPVSLSRQGYIDSNGAFNNDPEASNRVILQFKTQGLSKLNANFKPMKTRNPPAVSAIFGWRADGTGTMLRQAQWFDDDAIVDETYDVLEFDSLSFGYDNSFQPIFTIYDVAGEVRPNAVQNAIDKSLEEAKEYTRAQVGSGGSINVSDYGADPTGVTDSTAAFESALAECVSQGGGVVFAPDGYYRANIKVPDTAGRWMPLEIHGRSFPTQMFGTIGSFPINNFGFILAPFDPTKDVILQPSSSTGYSGFNLVNFILKNCTIRNSEATTSNALNLAHAAQCYVENVQIDNGVYSVQARNPVNLTAGIITPARYNAALTILKNIAISGHNMGVVVNEHTYIDYINLTCNKHAIVVQGADHASYITRACVQRNTIGLDVRGSHRLSFGQYNIEHAAPSQTDANNAWQLTQWDVNDPNNSLSGSAQYSVVLGNVGYDNNDWKKNGGTNFRTTPI